MKKDQTLEKGISDIVGVFTDPIIAWPGGWMDTIPEKVKEAITLERLIMCMKANKGEKMTATNAEALAYMYPRTMEAPIGHDWTQIYLWLGTQVFAKQFEGSDIEVKELNRDQMRMVNELKAWIYQKRIEARLDRDRGEKREKREVEVAARKAEQPALFDV